MKHFTEVNRLQEAVQLYSTLEDTDSTALDLMSNFSESGAAITSKRILSRMSLGKEILRMGNSMKFEDEASKIALSGDASLLQRFKAAIISRMFKINHLMLEYMAVTPVMYQIMMLIEHFQMLFFVFYKITIIDEFSEPHQVTIDNTAAFLVQINGGSAQG